MASFSSLTLFAIAAILLALHLDRVCKWSYSHAEVDRPRVETPLGALNGYYNVSYQARKYAVFESVPYALPPTGERRFQPPQPITPWSGDVEATTLPDACLHYNAVFDKISGREDCLYLNIYAPVVEDKNVSLPVLFWIHGGGFQRGTSSNYRARYLMDRDVILVTMNYRVGVFGFLSTGDEVVPGNMGLKDQNLALRWVSENIKHFGGDPKKITIAGVSAGGASVHYHYLSPMSRGLFRNGISFSGSALAPWTHTKNTSEVTKLLASAMNCPVTTGSLETVECLRKLPAKHIVEEVRNVLRPLATSFFLFPPVTEATSENYFINKSPEEIIRSGEAYDAPWIAGVVQDDGLFVTGPYILNDTSVNEVDANWRTYAPHALNYKFTKPEQEQGRLADAIRRHYFGERRFVERRERLTKLIGDDLIFVPTARAARMHAESYGSPVWFYYYTYRATQSYSDFLTNTTENIGVNHDDDVYLVLENRFIDPTRTEKDRVMLNEMLNFWYSFIDKGEPSLGIEWKTLNSDVENFRFMHIAGPKRYKMESNNNFGDIEFWSGIGL